jgi:hypothetical protein
MPNNNNPDSINNNSLIFVLNLLLIKVRNDQVDNSNIRESAGRLELY